MRVAELSLHHHREIRIVRVSGHQCVVSAHHRAKGLPGISASILHMYQLGLNCDGARIIASHLPNHSVLKEKEIHLAQEREKYALLNHETKIR
jgi:hypothetical protein